MTADWSKPTNTSAYTDVLSDIHQKILSSARLDLSGDSNVPTGAVQFSAAAKRLQSWNGSAWTTHTLHDVIPDKAGSETISGAWTYSGALSVGGTLSLGTASADGRVDILGAGSGSAAGRLQAVAASGFLNLDNLMASGVTRLLFAGVEKARVSTALTRLSTALQLGDSGTAANNFYLSPEGADGVLRIYSGNHPSGTLRFQADSNGWLGVAFAGTLTHPLTVGGSAYVAGALTLNASGPGIILQDTAARSAIIECSGGRVTFKRTSGTNSTTPSQLGGQWPLYLNLEDNAAVFGGNVSVLGGFLSVTGNIYGTTIYATTAQLSTVQSTGDLLLIPATSSNRVVISNLATVTGVSANAYFGSGNGISKIGSSLRYKRDITTLDETLAAQIVEGLRPVRYRSRCEGDPQDWSFYGLIAEEVAAVEPRLAAWADIPEVSAQGQVPDGVNYDRLAVVLLAVAQRQGRLIAGLERRIAELEGR